MLPSDIYSPFTMFLSTKDGSDWQSYQRKVNKNILRIIAVITFCNRKGGRQKVSQERQYPTQLYHYHSNNRQNNGLWSKMALAKKQFNLSKQMSKSESVCVSVTNSSTAWRLCWISSLKHTFTLRHFIETCGFRHFFSILNALLPIKDC